MKSNATFVLNISLDTTIEIGSVTGDDWDLSENGYDVLTLKTSYPHPEVSKESKDMFPIHLMKIHF